MSSSQNSESLLPPPTPSKAVWMLTFADLLSLVLTFFIVLYAMSRMPVEQWEPVAASFTQRLNPGKPNEKTNLTHPKGVEKTTPQVASNLDYLFNLLEAKRRQEERLAGVTLRHSVDAIVFSLPLPPDGKVPEAVIVAVGDLLAPLHNTVEIYVDGVPVVPSKLPEWQSSLEKSALIAESLKKAGYRYTIEAFGRMRAAKDLRVDVVIRDSGVRYP